MVHKIKAALDKNFTLSPKRKGRSGKKWLTKPRANRKIRVICVANRRKSAAFLTQMIHESWIAVSKRTAQRRLAEEGLTGYRPFRKPKLTAAMKKRRLTSAQEHRNMTVEDWSKVRYDFSININSF